MRLLIDRDGLCSHTGSMRCERCFPRIMTFAKEGSCVIEQEEDGSDFLTLGVIENGQETWYVLPPELQAQLMRESWPVILAAIEPYKTQR